MGVAERAGKTPWDHYAERRVADRAAGDPRPHPAPAPTEAGPSQ